MFDINSQCWKTVYFLGDGQKQIEPLSAAGGEKKNLFFEEN